MRQLISFFLGVSLITGQVSAKENYCEDNSKERIELIQPFNNKFCFATAEFMKTFATRLYDNKIPFVVYSNGHLGYKEEHKQKVQRIGDSLVAEYLGKNEK